MIYDTYQKYLITFFSGMFLGTIITTSSNHFSISNIPSTERVKSGYVAPADVRVTTYDLSSDGELETIVTIKDTPYLFLYDNKGNPVLSRYEIKTKLKVEGGSQ